jgi:hypothetical protein
VNLKISQKMERSNRIDTSDHDIHREEGDTLSSLRVRCNLKERRKKEEMTQRTEKNIIFLTSAIYNGAIVIIKPKEIPMKNLE